MLNSKARDYLLSKATERDTYHRNLYKDNTTISPSEFDDTKIICKYDSIINWERFDGMLKVVENRKGYYVVESFKLIYVIDYRGIQMYAIELSVKNTNGERVMLYHQGF